jgi:hypothetical protein
MANKEKLGEFLGAASPALTEVGLLTEHPLHLRMVTLENEGYRSVPVVSVTDHAGAVCDHKLVNFLPSSGLGVVHSLNFDESLRRLEGELRFERDLGADTVEALSSAADRISDFTCYLAEDFEFPTIARKASRRPGYQYEGRKYESIAQVISKAIHELCSALFETHPNTSCRMFAAFLCSYQVRRFILHFCDCLGESETAIDLTAGDAIEAKQQTECARIELFRRLNEFAFSENHPPVTHSGEAVSAELDSGELIESSSAEVSLSAHGNAGPDGKDEVEMSNSSDSDRSRKGDPALLANQNAVNFIVAQTYLGVKQRQRQILMDRGVLRVVGGGRNRKILVESLLQYLPLEKDLKNLH